MEKVDKALRLKKLVSAPGLAGKDLTFLLRAAVDDYVAVAERCERLEGALREIAQTMRADSESAQCAYQIATAALEVRNGEL